VRRFGHFAGQCRLSRPVATCLVLALGLLLCGSPIVTYAEVNVSGTAEDLHIATNDDSVAEVLSAIAAKCHASYRSSVNMDEMVSGSYSGPLESVMSRLLTDYNYVIRRDGETIEIIVLGRHGLEAIAPQSQPATPERSAASRWR
jgi:hypothetical protein